MFLIVLINWNFLNIGFNFREATSFEAASEPLLLIWASLGLWKDIFP